MLIQGQVGPISVTSSVAAGVQAPIRQGNMGEQIVSELHGRYAEATYRRAVYSIFNAAGVTHVAGSAAASYIGIAIGNPASSTVNVHVLQFAWVNIVALAAISTVGIQHGTGTITAALTPVNRYIGGAAGQCLATGGQNPMPSAMTVNQVFATVGSTLALTSWQPGVVNFVDLGGSIILPPNTFLASYMLSASGASGFQGGFVWEEVPI